jgi:3-oxoacyl-[acyl-carrier protein] reductase
MDLGLKGKVALVTAASEGLGFACAARLADEGCAVAICARRHDVLEAARARLARDGACDVLAVPADIADAAAVEGLVARTLAHFGRIDILVVNSGVVDYGGLEELSDLQWQHAYDLLLMSVVRITRLCLPTMRANKGGDIVFLGSATVREPPPQLLLSTVMRLGVAGFAKTLARALARDDIRVNLVAPGYFDAGRVNLRIRALISEKGLSRAAAEAQVSGDLPMGRVGRPEELAELVAFVASRKAGFMTGSMISIDGAGARTLF